MSRASADAWFVCRLALIYQRWLDEPEHRSGFHDTVRDRAWRWFSAAQSAGLVLQ